MSKRFTKANGTVAAKACFFTAVLNSLFTPSYGQEPPMPGIEPQDDLAERALQWGPFDVRPSIRGSIVYDDNIFIQRTDKKGDLIWTLTPGIMIGAGDYQGQEDNLFTLSYAPSFVLFTDHSEENAIDHQARMRAELHENRWSLAFQQGFQSLSGAVVDAGERVDRRLYDTTAQFKYEISPKTSFDLNGRQMVNDYDGLNDFNEWTIGAGVDYAVTPKISVGVGGVVGFVDVKSSVNQSYQQGLVRASYSVSEKLEAHGTLGGEVRQFQGDQSSRANLIYSVGGNYRPFINTSVTFDIYRRNQTSVALANQNYTTTGVGVGVRQKLREKYTVHLGVGYENSDYRGNTSAANLDREDNYYWVRTGVDWNVVERFTVGIFYQYRKNNSTSENFDFGNNQIGITAGYQF